MTGHAINQFYFPPKSLDLFQMKCNPLQKARTCTKSVLTPLECLDVSKINSYPLSSLEPILVTSTLLPLKFLISFYHLKNARTCQKAIYTLSMCPNFPQTISRPPPKCPNLSPINASPFQKAWTCPKSVLTQCIDFFNSVLILSNVPELIPN